MSHACSLFSFHLVYTLSWTFTLSYFWLLDFYLLAYLKKSFQYISLKWVVIGSINALYSCSNIQHRSSYYTLMEWNTYCTEIKYLYLELLGFYYILIGLSGQLFWDKEISKHVFQSKHVNRWNTNTKKIGSNVHLPCKLPCWHIINLRKQFYKHKLDVETLERIERVGIKKEIQGL